MSDKQSHDGSSSVQTNADWKKKGFQPKVFQDHTSQDQKIGMYQAIELQYKFSTMKKNESVLNSIKQNFSSILRQDVDWKQLRGVFNKWQADKKRSF